MSLKTCEVHIQGTPVSRGIAIGKPFFFSGDNKDTPDYAIAVENIDAEVVRFQRAVACSAEAVATLQKKLQHEGAVEGAAILEAHLQMMEDPLLTIEVEEAIRKRQRNAESVFRAVVNKYEKKFQRIQDPFYRERFKDIQDLARRICAHLTEEDACRCFDAVPDNSVVFGRDISVSEAAEASSSRIAAFVSETGGATGHAAIVAKARGIPYVTNVDLSVVQRYHDSDVVVDGRTGKVILGPTKETSERYADLKARIDEHFNNLQRIGDLPAETYDGYRLRLSANLEMVSEADQIHRYGCNGVGLFRSEFLLLARDTIPSEEEQYNVYRSLVDKMQGLPLVIRTFDIGNDKFSDVQQISPDGLPFLGGSAIRFLLKERDIFKAQVRAILRAAAFGKVSIMFPMISALTELLEAKQLVKEARQELKQKGVTKPEDFAAIIATEVGKVTTALNARIDASEQKTASANAALATEKLRGTLTAAGIKASVAESAIGDFVTRATGTFKVVDGKVVAVNPETGVPLFSQKTAGQPLSPEEYAEGLQKTAPHFFKSSEGADLSGSGPNPNEFTGKTVTEAEMGDHIEDIATGKTTVPVPWAQGAPIL